MCQLFSVQLLFWFCYKCAVCFSHSYVVMFESSQPTRLPAQPSLIPSSASQHKEGSLLRATICQTACVAKQLWWCSHHYHLPISRFLPTHLSAAASCCLTDYIPAASLICYVTNMNTTFTILALSVSASDSPKGLQAMNKRTAPPGQKRISLCG